MPLVPEVSYPGEYHRYAVFIRLGYYFVVPYGASRLRYRSHPALCGQFHVVGKGKEGVRPQHASL